METTIAGLYRVWGFEALGLRFRVLCFWGLGFKVYGLGLKERL